MEYAPHGNLKEFLRERRPCGNYEKAIISMPDYEYTLLKDKPLSEKDLISFSYQIARGMEYLSSRMVRTRFIPVVHNASRERDIHGVNNLPDRLRSPILGKNRGFIEQRIGFFCCVLICSISLNISLVLNFTFLSN